MVKRFIAGFIVAIGIALVPSAAWACTGERALWINELRGTCLNEVTSCVE